MNYRLLPKYTASEIYFTQIGKISKCWLSIYRVGTGRAVTGRIRDTGQKVLRYSFYQTGSSKRSRYFQIFFLITFFVETFIWTAKYVIIILLIKYAITIIRCINLLKPTGHVMHQQLNIQQLYALPTLYLCVLYLSENKQRLVPLTA